MGRLFGSYFQKERRGQRQAREGQGERERADGFWPPTITIAQASLVVDDFVGCRSGSDTELLTMGCSAVDLGLRPRPPRTNSRADNTPTCSFTSIVRP